MKASFSIDQHDKDGDVFDECILLHLEPNTIIRFDNYREFSAFVDSLPSVRNELRENLSPERRAVELATDTQQLTAKISTLIAEIYSSIQADRVYSREEVISYLKRVETSAV